MTRRQHNFDHVAHLYRWAEYLLLGPALVRTRNHFLPRLTYCRRALVLGDGDGRFLARLLKQNPDLHALAVDTSETMLHLLRERCLRVVHDSGKRLKTLHASALLLPFESCDLNRSITACSSHAQEKPSASGDTDLIVTHFFLDCFAQSDIDALALRIAAHVRPGTLWLLSDFAIPQSPLLRLLATIYVRSLYLAFRLLTGLRTTQLPGPYQALTAAGFQRIERHQLLSGLLYTELWQRQ